MFACEQPPQPLNAQPNSLCAHLDLAAFVHLPHLTTPQNTARFPLAALTLRSPGGATTQTEKSTPIHTARYHRLHNLTDSLIVPITTKNKHFH